MKISQMLRREDFYTINNITLSRYFSFICQKEVKISISPNFIGESHLFVYPTINAIVTANPSRDVKNFLYREFNLSSNILLKKLVSFYVHLLLNSRGILSSKRIVITPKIEGLDSYLIYPGNRRIRVFHFDEGFVDVILKDSFSSYFFERDIEFRMKYLHLPFVLPIIKYTTMWFRESIIEGISLARISDKKVYVYVFSKLFQALDSFQKKSINYIKAGEYCKFLFEKIYKKSKMLENKLLDFNFERNLSNLVYYLAQKIEPSFDIPLSISHGDLQEGNVIWEDKNNKIYIIDWETWGKRSVWYDQLILIYKLRREDTFFENLKQYLFGDLNSKISYKLDDEGTIFMNNINERQQISRVFLLEDILWQIEETENLPEGVMGFGLKFYINIDTQRRLRQLL